MVEDEDEDDVDDEDEGDEEEEAKSASAASSARASHCPSDSLFEATDKVAYDDTETEDADADADADAADTPSKRAHTAACRARTLGSTRWRGK